MDQTHIPVLVALSKFVEPLTILECGPGDSTRVFLNPRIYPSLVRLDTLENGPPFYKREVEEIINEDLRCRLHYDTQDMVSLLSNYDIPTYDIIYLDDSTTLQARVKTIQYVTHNAVGNTIIVIHDFEHIPYQKAVHPSCQQIVFDFTTPYTGILCMNPSFDLNLIRKYNFIMKEHYDTTLGDVEEWQRLFNLR